VTADVGAGGACPPSHPYIRFSFAPNSSISILTKIDPATGYRQYNIGQALNRGLIVFENISANPCIDQRIDQCFRRDTIQSIRAEWKASGLSP
jgi:hypothetical protein